MTVYEENLRTLAAAYSQMDKLIEEAKEKKKEKEEPSLELMEEEAMDGTKILRVRKGGRSCYLNGRRNTTEAAKYWVDTLGELQTNAPVFMMGLGNPSYLKELAERTNHRIAIVIYEPSFEIFLNFLENVPLQRWMEKHQIIFWVKGLEGMDDEAMGRALRRMVTYEMIPYSRKLILPNYDVLFAEEAVAFLQVIRDFAQEEVVQYNTQQLFSAVMAKNILENMKYLCDGYKTTQLVEVIPRDIPGIVVAAGPSLNKNIKELKRAKGKAFIIAVDTALKPLLAEGIVPDMFAVVDGKKPIELVRTEAAKDIPLLSAMTANSEVLKYHTGMKFFYNEGVGIADHIMWKSGKRHGGVDSGGSVATSVFSLLYKIGFTRVILVGQDLAYTGNKSHADGTFSDVMEEEDTKNYIMVEGNLEENVPTISNLKVYLEWYNMYIEGIQKRNKDFRVINATEGGAKIKNTEVMTLHDAIEQECTKEVDIQECLSRLQPMFSGKSREWAQGYLKGLPEKFHELAKNARKAKGLYVKLDKVCNKKNIDKKEYVSVLKKIEKIIKKIETNEVYQLVCLTMVNAQYILWSEQFLHEETVKKEGRELARKGILYTENVGKMAELFGEFSGEIYTEFFNEGQKE